jgi:ubiquinone/menaquinone biosynthesis C-methylase UbiE
MREPDPLDEEVLAYYARGLEDERLIQNAEGVLERVRTEELLERFLPPPPNVVLDVGGGTGHYAVWLAERGYEVHFSDPVPLHIEQARHRSSAATRPLASISLSDARSLGIADSYASAVLLLGPLYHLTTRADRLAALREAGRVLRQDLDAQWQNPIRRSAILGLVRTIEAEASMLGVSSHLLAIGRR